MDYSNVHKMYTTIDLLLVDQGTLDLLIDTTIDQITISDHAPVTLSLSLPQVTAGTSSGKLNENLLDDLDGGFKGPGDSIPLLCRKC